MDSEKRQISLLDRWKESKINKSGLSIITKAPEGAKIPLSSGQQRLWFLQQLFPTNSFYNVSSGIVLKGRLKEEVLIKSIEEVICHNEILKSTYPTIGALPVIRIDNSLKYEINQVDCSQFSDADLKEQTKLIIAQQAATQFDLENGPLFRFSIIKQKGSKFLLFMTMHHIIIDIWSLGLLKEQIVDSYKFLIKGETVNLEDSEIQFSDYAYWQRNRPKNESVLKFWNEKLSGELPILDLPVDRKHPLIPSFKGENLKQNFTIEFSDEIFGLAKFFEVTPFVLLLSTYYVLLYKHTSQEDIIVGSPLSIRNDKSLEGILGFFVDTIVLRSAIEPQLKFSELVKQVRDEVLMAFSNKELPFDELVKELKIDRSLTTNPLFQTMFVYDSEPKVLYFGDGVEIVEDFEFAPRVAKFDLTLFVKELHGKLSLTFEYATDVLETPTVQRFQEHIKLILERVVKNPEVKIKEIEVLTKEEKNFFLKNDLISDNPFENYTGIHKIIGDFAVKTPNAVAVICDNKSTSYKELIARAETLVPLILNHTKGENRFIALATNRSLEMIVGILAILKAGSAYLPIDADYPKQRIDFMLEDAGVELVLTQEILKDNFDTFNGNILCVDQNNLDIRASEIIEKVFPNKNDLAYIIYTSGSTGTPKGVPITHENIMNSTAGRLDFYENNPSVFLLLSSFSFDSSKAGIFWTLCTGGTLLISAKRAEQDLKGLAQTIKRYNVSHTLMLPTLYDILLDYASEQNFDSLTNVIVAGETCPSELVKKHFEVQPQTLFYNEYGPTEAAVWCVAHKIIPENSENSVPIGKSVANAQVYLLDGDRNLVPYGAIGEIYIGGISLSSGYLNRPDLVAESFFDNPFGSQVGDKIYKTGDFGRYNQNEEIEYLGRDDDQIKIRGYRIELDEIENVISRSIEIQDVVVLIEEDKAKSKRLIAFVQADDSFDEKTLKLELRERIPDYMIPGVFVKVDIFPILPNGKIDKNMLLSIDRPQIQKTIEGDDLPTNEIEHNLVSIWQEILQLSSIGVNDNFFEIGGDSILSIQMLSKAREEKIPLSPNQIFEYQTIRELAAFVLKNKGTKEKWDYLVPFRTEGSKKPLFCLHAGGGHVFFYKGLVDHIDSERPLYALQASGVYGKKSMHNSISDMADDYIKIIKSVQKSGPYNVLIYCFSATVGHEISMKMKSSGDICNLIVMDTMAKPWTLNTPNRIKVRVLGFYRRLMNKPFNTLNHMVSIRLNNLMKQTYKVIGNEEQKSLEELRENLARLSRSYEWKPFDGEISLILTKKPHESLNQETINSWKEFAQGGIRILKTTGNHSFLFEPENLSNLAKRIEQCTKD